MSALVYDPPEPQTTDNERVIMRKTQVNISRIADLLDATNTNGNSLIYAPPQPQDTDSQLIIFHKTSVNVSRIADVICQP